MAKRKQLEKYAFLIVAFASIFEVYPTKKQIY